MTKLPAIASLREALTFNPISGVLTWLPRSEALPPICPAQRKRWNARHAGQSAGYVCGEGYREIKFLGQPLQTHRVAWALYHGEWPDGFIDHINGNRTDNRIANLRVVTRAENMRNTRLNSRNTSGRIGVSYAKAQRTWVANIRVDNKQIYLGQFQRFEDAETARSEAERKYGFHPNHGSRAQ